MILSSNSHQPTVTISTTTSGASLTVNDRPLDDIEPNANENPEVEDIQEQVDINDLVAAANSDTEMVDLEAIVADDEMDHEDVEV